MAKCLPAPKTVETHFSLVDGQSAIFAGSNDIAKVPVHAARHLAASRVLAGGAVLNENRWPVLDAVM
jgi:hypothetical protein